MYFNDQNPMCNNKCSVRNRRSDPFFEVCRPDASETNKGLAWVVR